MTTDQILNLLKSLSQSCPSGDVRFQAMDSVIHSLFGMGLMSHYDFVHIFEMLAKNKIDFN